MSTRSILFALIVGVAACGGAAKKESTTTTEQASAKSLYDRLGGVDGIKAVVKDFVEVQVANDVRINTKFFSNADLPKLQDLMVNQICEATGGPCKYTGRSMKEAHAGMGVDEASFGALVEDLVKSLTKLNVPKAEQDELIAALATMHDDIVEKK
jgi:hemoglobin